MAVVVSHESFWAVVALFFLWIILSCRWACNTVFTVPKWQVAWANALVGVFLVNHLSSVDGFAFTLVGDWVHGSWGLALETFASSGDFTVSVVSRAWFAL